MKKPKKKSSDTVTLPSVMRVSIGEGQQSKVVKVHTFPADVPIAKVTTHIGLTLRPKPFNSISISVGIEEPCVNSKIAKKQARASAAKLIIDQLPKLAVEAKVAFDKAVGIVGEEE